MTDTTIIPFPSKDGDITDLANVQKPDRQFCRHARVVLDEATRTIECSDCGSLLEPFDWALRWANKNSRESQQVLQMRKERQSLLSGIEALRREERNTKARLNTARKGLEKVVVDQRDVQLAKEQIKRFREGVE